LQERPFAVKPDRTMDSPRALLTGASSGIGMALAERMAARGVAVWLAARRTDRLDEVARRIRAQGGQATPVALDVGQPDVTAARVAALDAEVGGFDVVVANAGIGGTPGPAARTSWQTARDTLTVNLLGAVATLVPLIEPMLERHRRDGRRGHLVGVTSLAGEIRLPQSIDYGASKAGLSFFLESAQMDLPARGVDVTVVKPGFVKTELTANARHPMPFLLELDECARIMDEAIEARAATCVFPRGLVALIGAANLLPRSAVAQVVSKRARR
jgi:short-subunit dehydrogenase